MSDWDDIASLSAYTQAYPDLLLWLSETGDRRALHEHLKVRSPIEGRVLPGSLHAPGDWSDELAHRHVCQLASDLWRLGTLETTYFRAQIETPNGFDANGRLSENSYLKETTSLPAEALAQLVAIERHRVPAPLHASLKGKFSWASLPVPAIEKFRNFIRDQAGMLGEFNAIILVPWLETGGAEQVAYWHYCAAQSLGLSPLLVCTDHENIARTYAEMNLSILSIPRIFNTLLEIDYRSLSIEQRIFCLGILLKFADARIVHLVHSYAGYRLAEHPELGKMLALSDRLLVSAFCPHIHADGRVEGYFRHIPAIDSSAAAYIFDSETYARELTGMYGLEPVRVHSLKYPIAAAGTRPPGIEHGKTVLWASRLDFQKNPGLVFEIAKNLPETMFHIYGRSVMSDDEFSWAAAPPNVLYKGEFFGFSSITIDEYCLFLYTARFDGMPNIILEVAAAGLPIVTSAVGGIPEFIGPAEGVLVADSCCVDEYVAGLRLLLGSRELRMSMSEALLRKVRQQRSFETFVGAVRKLPVYRDLNLDGRSPVLPLRSD